MSLLRVVLALAAGLALQAGVGRLWPDAGRYMDVLLVPVVWYGISSTPRAAMGVGCAAGLLEDAWFEAGVFGLNGFKRTFLGWALGSLGSRFDLNRGLGRFGSGFLVSLADSLMDLGLRQLLDQHRESFSAPGLVIKACTTGALVSLVFAVAERRGARWQSRRPGR